MITLPIKALSVNDAYRGRRFATRELSIFKRDFARLLPQTTLGEGFLSLTVAFGISSGSDLDNCLKTTIDCLAEIIGFNDNRIYKIQAEKVKVKKGEEFIAFELSVL